MMVVIYIMTTFIKCYSYIYVVIPLQSTIDLDSINFYEKILLRIDVLPLYNAPDRLFGNKSQQQ